MAATETAKKTADQATNAAAQAQAAGAQAFREGVDKSLSALTELNTLGKKNVEAVVESVTAATRGAEAIGAQTLAFTKKNWEDGVNAAQALAGARSVQEAIELQTSFAKTAMETYLAEVTRLTDTMTASVKDTFKPINERMTAVVERVQSAR